ncbi:MAG: methylhydantoinase [Alphaproteobacteria bacterium]|nr:MAG: methylhydantoinase [Alphaproteobacteria bacterium]
MKANASVDPITVAVIKGGLEQIVDEMDAIIVRAAFSSVISEQKDRASGIFHPVTGEMVAQGSYTLPVFMTAMQFSVQTVLQEAERRGGFRPGDVYIMNQPYLGGTHLPDVKLIAPAFSGGRMVALLAACGHWNDIGGSTPGGFAPGATEVFQEGIIINPVPLYREGRLEEDFLRLILDNVRMPDERRGDIEATISALRVGASRFDDLVKRYGAQAMLASFAELNDRSERHMRSLIESIPDRTYEFEDAVDNDGHVDAPLRIRLRLTVKGDRVSFDFSESSPPARGPLNVPMRTSVASCQIAMKHIFPEIPINGGCFRPFDYVIPSTTFLGAGHPHAISGYPETVGRIISVVFGALAQALPDRVPADNFGTTGIITFSGTHPTRGNYYVMLFPAAGGYGGSPQSDGLVNGPTALGAANYPSVESVEHRVPVRIERLAIRERSGGAGRHAGGCGTSYAYRILDGEVAAVVLGDRSRFAPFGILGGKPGLGADVIFHEGGESSRLPLVTKGRRILKAGDRLEYHSPGGGGYGDPRERDPELVLRDVTLGYIDAKAARTEYAVVVKAHAAPDGATAWRLDHNATAKLRASASQPAAQASA